MELHASGQSAVDPAAKSSSASPARKAMSTLEIRTYSFSDTNHDTPGSTGFVIELSGKVSTLFEQASRLMRTLREDIETIIKNSRSAYMPNVPYDKCGSTVRRLANDYVIIRHVVLVSDVDEAEIHGRMELVDIMLEDGWELLAQASHSNSPGVSTSSLLNPATVVETWVKRH